MSSNCTVSTGISDTSPFQSQGVGGNLKSQGRHYATLLGHEQTSPAHAIVFGWWPRSANWTWDQLVERTTRCLPAVRPDLDIVALPEIPAVQELWDTWSQVYKLSPDQAVWFAPNLGEDKVEDPAVKACREVLGSPQVANRLSSSLSFYPMYVTRCAASEAAARGLKVIGDPEDHELGPLSSAKAWLHPRIIDGSHETTPSLRDVVSLTSQGARAPRGYVATSLGGLHEAWRRLQKESPKDTRFVLKPSSGSGGCGVVLDAQWDDLSAFDFSDSCSAILEELVVGGVPLQSPTLYMIGDTPCGRLADQVFLHDGVSNVGNIYPSRGHADLLTVCTDVAHKVNAAWGLTSNWGLDFIINTAGDPILVDLNMGRPNGNFAVRLWACLRSHELSIFTGAWVVPSSSDPGIQKIYDALRNESLSWNGHEGVIVYQHIPGLPSSYAVASASGQTALISLLRKLRKVMREHFSIDVSADV